MLKFLLILFVLGWLIYKVFGFLFKIFFIGASAAQHQKRTQQSRQSHARKAPDSNLNIDYVPGSEKKKGDKGFDGGDYVDYEELK
ncbi:MAG: DUF4834 family protein [Cyclobacteriaceae bacterium]